ALLRAVDAELPGRTAHPAWFAAKVLEAWPGQAVALLEADNVHPPMTLRVDLTRTSRDAYVARLADASIGSKKIQRLEAGVVLERPVSVSDLPGFAAGEVSVQDAGAQLAARLLHLRPGQRVLDACAAPGGKTGALLEAVPDLVLTAVDVDTARAALVEENLGRLGRQARVAVADMREPEVFWDGEPFDRILVDAPCSSTGVIRRHPDIKLLRRPSDIPAFAATQLAILRGVAGLLAPGGRLLYVSCSVLPAENEEVVNELLAETAELTLASMASPAAIVPGARLRRPGLRLLPGAEAGTDGFYYACLEKTTVGA